MRSGPLNWSRWFWRRENLAPLPEFEIGASYPSVVAVPNTLSVLRKFLCAFITHCLLHALQLHVTLLGTRIMFIAKYELRNSSLYYKEKMFEN